MNERALLTPSAIDISRLPEPAILEDISYADLQAGFIDRFIAVWDAARIIDPTLPNYDVQMMDSDPAMFVSQAFSFLRMLDRGRINDAVKAMLVAFAKGTNLDAIVARQGLVRLDGETDVQLLRRYLLSFERASAGSPNLYKFAAYSAFPNISDVRVNGRAVHGRTGDTDIVYTLAGGQLLDGVDEATLRAKVLDPANRAEARDVALFGAQTLHVDLNYRAYIALGDVDIVRAEIEKRITAATSEREFIGAQLPADYLIGAAYGPNIIDVNPVGAAPDYHATPYQVPVLRSLNVEVILT